MTSIEAGQWSACATYTDGTVRCWGDNHGGGLGGGDETDYKGAPTPVVGLGQVSTLDIGSLGICALTTAGHVRCVGMNDTGQLGYGPTTGYSTAWVTPIGF